MFIFWFLNHEFSCSCEQIMIIDIKLLTELFESECNLKLIDSLFPVTRKLHITEVFKFGVFYAFKLVLEHVKVYFKYVKCI